MRILDIEDFEKSFWNESFEKTLLAMHVIGVRWCAFTHEYYLENFSKFKILNLTKKSLNNYLISHQIQLAVIFRVIRTKNPRASIIQRFRLHVVIICHFIFILKSSNRLVARCIANASQTRGVQNFYKFFSFRTCKKPFFLFKNLLHQLKKAKLSLKKNRNGKSREKEVKEVWERNLSKLLWYRQSQYRWRLVCSCSHHLYYRLSLHLQS